MSRAERRRSKRIRIDNEVVISRLVAAEGLDLSDDGMYIYVSRPFVENSIVALEFKLDGETINVPARVLHSQPGIGFGVNFFDFPEEAREKIEAFVSNRQAEGG